MKRLFTIAALAALFCWSVANSAHANGGYGGGDDVQVFEQQFAPQFAPADDCYADVAPQQQVILRQAAPRVVYAPAQVQRAPQIVYQAAPLRVVIQRAPVIVQRAPQRRGFAPLRGIGGGRRGETVIRQRQVIRQR